MRPRFFYSSGGWSASAAMVLGAAFLLAGILTAVDHPAAGGIYQWRDKQGVLHFSDSPPAPADPEVTRFTEWPNDEQVSRAVSEAPTVGSAGVFWRIDRPDTPPSFLLGTIHSSDPRVTALPPAVKQALEASDILVMEMVLKTDSFLQFGGAMMATDGSDLKRLLGARDFGRLTAALSAFPLPEPMVRKLKPWAALALISQPRQPNGLFLDLVLYQIAISAAKPVVGLETAEEQIEVFDGMSVDDQVSLLKDSLDQIETMPSMHERMIETYLANDLNAIDSLARELSRSSGEALARRYMDRLNASRNERMVARMLRHLESGGAFVAVGALHLAGEGGIVNLLPPLGYRLSPIP
jgi:uncharacterized protein YbaP (TraB family)